MPQAVAAAAVWVGNAVGAAIVGGGAALGVGLATTLPLAAAAAKGAFLVAEIALYTGLSNLVDDIATQKAAPQGQELSLRIATDVAREMVIGVRPTGGSMVARYSYGKDLTQSHFVYQLADHPIVELSQVWGDGRLVRDTPLTHGVRTEITAYSYSGGPRVWMTFYDGRPGQSHDAWLVTKSATDPDVIAGAVGGWTSAHVGAGISYICVEVHKDSDILTSIPEFLFHLKGAKLYDRRKDTTAGGSGSHRHNDPSTWEYSTNNAVACDHYLLGYQVEDDDLAFGVGLSPVEVPYSTFAAAADLCDENVTTGTGGDVVVMKRYACNAIISTAEPFESVLVNFQNQMAARIVDLGGRIGIIGGEEKAAWLTLDDTDWASDDSVRFADKLSGDNLVGAVVGSYPDPANLFQPTPYERQATDYLYLPNGGEAATAQLDLPFETNSRRAVRLAAAWIKRESIQPRIAGTFATRSQAWKLEPGDWFELNSDRWQLTAVKFEVVDIVKHDDFTVTLTARACDPDFLVFPVDEDPDLSVPPSDPPASLLLTAPTFTVAASTLTALDTIEPCIEFTLTNGDNIGRDIVVEIGLWNGSVILSPTTVDQFHASQVVTKLRKGVLPSSTYKVRAKVRVGSRESEWSAWSSAITTSAAYKVPEAGYAGEALPGGVLDLALTAASERLDVIAGGDFPGFSFIGGHGDIDIEANVDAPADIKVSAGYLEHPTLGEIAIALTQFDTAWGELFAPWLGFFGLAWSDEPVADRFANGAGEGHIFPFAYDEDGTLRAYGLDLNAGEIFTPELTDMVLARCEKPRATGSDILSSADGVTNVDNLIRDTTVVNARLEVLEATSGDNSAAIVDLSVALADEVSTRASQTTTLTTNLGTANAAIATNATAISTEAAARASADSTLTANLATANANIATNASAIATETSARASADSTLTASVGTLTSSVSTNASAIASVDGRVGAFYGIKVDAGTQVATVELMASGGGVPSLVKINAGQIELHGDVVVTNTLTAAKIVDLSIPTGKIADSAVSTTSAMFSASGATTSISVTTTGGDLVISASFQSELGADGGPSDYATHDAEIARGATVIYESYGPINQAGAGVSALGYSIASWAATTMDSPAAGTYTFSVSAPYNNSNGNTNQMRNVAIVVTELKK